MPVRVGSVLPVPRRQVRVSLLGKNRRGRDRKPARGHDQDPVFSRPRFAVLLTLLAPACSYLYPYSYELSISEDVEAPSDAEVVFAWSRTTELIDAHATDFVPVDEIGERYVLETEASGPSRQGELELSFFAFIDLDGSGAWDPGEPWGEDPNNPVVFGIDGYRASIVIDPDDE